MVISDEEYELANKRAEEMKRTVPYATGAQFEDSSRHLMLTLSTGGTLRVPIGAFPELAAAQVPQLINIEISPSGYGIWFPELDVDLYVPGLLEEFGSASQRALAEQARQFR